MFLCRSENIFYYMLVRLACVYVVPCADRRLSCPYPLQCARGMNTVQWVLLVHHSLCAWNFHAKRSNRAKMVSSWQYQPGDAPGSIVLSLPHTVFELCMRLTPG